MIIVDPAKPGGIRYGLPGGIGGRLFVLLFEQTRKTLECLVRRAVDLVHGIVGDRIRFGRCLVLGVVLDGLGNRFKRLIRR